MTLLDGTLQSVLDCVAKPLDSDLFDGHHGYDRNRQRLLQCLEVDGDSQFFGDVVHVQRDDDRSIQLQHLRGQKQVALQIGCVQNAHDHVRRGVVVMSQKDVEDDGLVRLVDRQTVRPRQVKNLHRRTGVGGPKRSGTSFDGDAGVVADALPEAGQGIEQRALAGVGIADQGDGPGSRRGMNGERGWHGGGRRLPDGNLIHQQDRLLQGATQTHASRSNADTAGSSRANHPHDSAADEAHVRKAFGGGWGGFDGRDLRRFTGFQ